MSRNFILIAFIFFNHPGIAQIRSQEFEAPAKIILLNNDTVYGITIIDTTYTKNDFLGSDLGRKFFFKQNGKDKIQRYYPDELNGFQIKTGDGIWAEFISSQSLPNFAGVIFHDNIFLLKILEGDMSFYYYFHFDEIANELKINNGKLTKVLYKKGDSKVFCSDIEQMLASKLVSFVDDCTDLAGKLKAVRCKGWSYLQIAAYYNHNCK